MNGSDKICNGICGQPGVYGNLGTPAVGNYPGGRYGATAWTDSSNNFWLFGGKSIVTNGVELNANDLWEFSPDTNEWAWMGGSKIVPTQTVPAAGQYGSLGQPGSMNVPGARSYAASWVDNSGNLWLFGGSGIDADGVGGCLNDLWRFNPFTNEWAWQGGSSTTNATRSTCGRAGVYRSRGTPDVANIPGGRSESVTWVDKNGHFWLFGGFGLDSQENYGILNDLWEFDPSKNEWTWISGSNSIPATSNGSGGASGVYGTRGIPAPGNTPGSRSGGNGWVDPSGSLWLFGGGGIDSAGTRGGLNDLWEFSPADGQWTWVCGSNIVGDTGYSPGPCGDSGSPTYGYLPGSTGLSASWTDSSGQFWLFGGIGMNQIWPYFWVFNPASKEWVWKDSSSPSQNFGNYGILGTPSPGNLPGPRDSSSGWVDASGNLWLFGGEGYGAANPSGIAPYGFLYDLWVFSPAGISLSRATEPTFSVPPGNYGSAQTINITDSTPAAVIYYTTDGTTPTTTSVQYTGPITVTSTETIKAIASASGYASSEVAWATYAISTIPPAATPVFSLPSGTYTSAQNVTITDDTPNAAIYYTADGSTPTTLSTAYTGAIAVSKSETINAIAIANGYTASAVASATYTINLPPNFTLASSSGALTVSHGASGTVTLTVTPQNGFNSAVSFACSGQPAGASCTFSPSTVTPSGSAAITTLKITAPAQSAALHQGVRFGLHLTVVAFAVGWFGIRRRRALWWTPLLVILAGAGFVTGCGGGGGTSASGGGGTGSKPATYTVIVTASSGTIQQTTTISLTVD